MKNILFLAADAAPVVGRIQGGWEYVWASYFITWGALALFGLSLAGRRQPAHRGLFSALAWWTLGLTLLGIFVKTGAIPALRLLPLVPFGLGTYLLHQHLRRAS